MIKKLFGFLIAALRIPASTDERVFLKKILKNFSVGLRGKKILDIGAGECLYRNFFTGQNTYESSDLEEGFHKEQKHDFYSSVYAIPRNNDSYDVVLLLQVLEHLEFPVKALKEVNRILKQEGTLFLSVPQGAGDHFEPHHYFNYTQFGLKSVLRQAGFEISEHYRLAGIFTYVGNRFDKMGNILYDQYRLKGNWAQIFLAGIFSLYCNWTGWLISKFDFLDKRKHYCVGHVVIAKKQAFSGGS